METRLILCLFVLVISTLAEPSQSHQEEFIPTEQWQIVREGQAVPPGLHIRLNLETGLREAKLLDDNETPSSHSVISVPSETTQEEMSRQNLEQAFAQLDLSKDDVQTDKSHEDEVRQKYRSYEELKKDFESINVKIQTDQEILGQLIAQLNKTQNDDDRTTILTDLEYYLHQYDNGIFFADNNGLTLLIQLLNASDTRSEIRHLTSLALGAAFQGNPQVQLKALHLDFVPSLLRLFNRGFDDNIKLRLLYPLSALLRNFPQGQIQFLDHGGAEVMVNLVDAKQINQKLAVRAMTLMSDLIVEKEQATESKRPAYDNIDIRQQLVTRGWCAEISSRLRSLDVEDFDPIEKTVHSLIPFISVCRPEFDSLLAVFDQFHTIYREQHLSDQSTYGDLLDDLQLLRDKSRTRSSDEL